jgi:hypothetical protein
MEANGSKRDDYVMISKREVTPPHTPKRSVTVK